PSDEDQTQGFFAALGLSAPQPNLPSSEYIVDFYANNDFTEWVGSFIRLCNGATLREGIQTGWTKTEETMNCHDTGTLSNCYYRRCDPNCNDPNLCCAWVLLGGCPCRVMPDEPRCVQCPSGVPAWECPGV
ncbi:MAG: hypothetical protein ACP5NF_11940, partial [Thermoanaerobaculum sp.]